MSRHPFYNRCDSPYTVVVGLDPAHVDQFLYVWPTWRRHRPELLAAPWLLMCDVSHAGRPPEWYQQQLAAVREALPDHRLAWWDWINDYEPPGLTPRERMLTAFVHLPFRHVTTSYWLKIDTDVVCLPSSTPFPDPAWFGRGREVGAWTFRTPGGPPALIAPGWPYTKPADWPKRLQAWANAQRAFATHPPLVLPELPRDAEVCPLQRICSYVCFVDTVWSRLVAGYCPGRLPVPSQDTYHWYCAARRGDPILKFAPKQFGFVTRSSRRGRQELVEQSLAAKVAQHN